jgi:hypothetical protein
MGSGVDTYHKNPVSSRFPVEDELSESHLQTILQTANLNVRANYVQGPSMLLDRVTCVLIQVSSWSMTGMIGMCLTSSANSIASMLST